LVLLMASSAAERRRFDPAELAGWAIRKCCYDGADFQPNRRFGFIV
jgi:hypothetical protein